MIQAQDAVRRAIAAVQEFTQDPRAQYALLEEIELVRENGSAQWAITVSLPARLPIVGVVTAALGGEYQKDYKVVTLDADSGAFLSMKIRKI